MEMHAAQSTQSNVDKEGAVASGFGNGRGIMSFRARLLVGPFCLLGSCIMRLFVVFVWFLRWRYVWLVGIGVGGLRMDQELFTTYARWKLNESPL